MTRLILSLTGDPLASGTFKSNLINVTQFFYRNGEKTDYTGGRTSDTIVSWILKKSGPPSTQVTCATLKEKLENLNLQKKCMLNV